MRHYAVDVQTSWGPETVRVRALTFQDAENQAVSIAWDLWREDVQVLSVGLDRS